MLQPGSDLDFAQEPLCPDGGGELGVQHLQRNGTAVLDIRGEKHGGHSTAAQLPLDDVAVGERCLEVCDRVRHECAALPCETAPLGYRGAAGAASGSTPLLSRRHA